MRTVWLIKQLAVLLTNGFIDNDDGDDEEGEGGDDDRHRVTSNTILQRASEDSFEREMVLIRSQPSKSGSGSKEWTIEKVEALKRR